MKTVYRTITDVKAIETIKRRGVLTGRLITATGELVFEEYEMMVINKNGNQLLLNATIPCIEEKYVDFMEVME